MSSMDNESNFTCYGVIPNNKSESICVMEFHDALLASNCSQDTGDPTFVLYDARDEANKMFISLDYLNASEDCKHEITSLLCNHIFRICSNLRDLIHPMSSHCKTIRDSLCLIEWAKALHLGNNLPDCESFPLESAVCQNMSDNTGKTYFCIYSYP